MKENELIYNIPIILLMNGLKIRDSIFPKMESISNE